LECGRRSNSQNASRWLRRRAPYHHNLDSSSGSESFLDHILVGKEIDKGILMMGFAMVMVMM
jgi:hypothetical protein